MTLAKALGVEDQEPRRSSSHKELRRANEILKAASSFFARELDPRLPAWIDLLSAVHEGVHSEHRPLDDPDAEQNH